MANVEQAVLELLIYSFSWVEFLSQVVVSGLILVQPQHEELV